MLSPKTKDYPVYIYKDPDSDYGLRFPDAPNCFASAKHKQDIPKAAQEAFKAFYGHRRATIPSPSTIEKWEKNEDYEGGEWRYVTLDI